MLPTLRPRPTRPFEEQGVGRTLRLARGAITREAIEVCGRGYSVVPTSVVVPDMHPRHGCCIFFSLTTLTR